MAQDLRAINRTVVLTELLRARPSSRSQIAEGTGISPTTVSRVVEDLKSEGIVVDLPGTISHGRGRPVTQIDIAADLGYAIGVDLGASNTRCTMMDLRGAVIRTNEQATPSSLDPAELAAWTLGVGSNLAGAEWKHTRHIGIGVPGAVGKNGQITNAPNLHQIEHPQFIRTLQHEQARHIHIDNDANYALIAELLLGAAYDASSAAMITIGTGLGVGLATDGKILRGRRGIVGEYGYLPVGPLGTRLENLLTGPHLLQYAHDSGIMISSPAEIFTPTADRKLQALRTQFDQALTIVLTAVIVSNEPSLVILGGGIARSLGPHLSDYEQAIEDNLQFHTPLVLASLGDFSGAHGAALTALQHSYIDIGVDPSLASMLPGTRPATGEENRQTRTSK